MKFFGFSFKDVSGTVKVVYAVIFLAIFGGAVYYGLSKLDNNKKKKVKSPKKKSPKKR